MKLFTPKPEIIHKLGLQILREDSDANAGALLHFEHQYNEVTASRKSYSSIEVCTSGVEIRRTSLRLVEASIRKFKEKGGTVFIQRKSSGIPSIVLYGVSFTASPRLVKNLIGELNELQVLFTYGFNVTHA